MLRVPNPAVWWVGLGAAGFLTLAQVLPAVRAVFRFSRPELDDMAMCVVAGAVTVAWFELLKLARRARVAASAAH
jgi:Ca2+-transporting ATPase